MKKLALLLFVLLSLPVLAAPLFVRGETPISAPEFVPLRQGADAHIATNGDQYLVVWTDVRRGGSPSVYAARLHADGTPIDPLGLRVAAEAHAGPVIWTGSKYLITYQDRTTALGYARTMTLDAVFGEPVSVMRNVHYGAMATNGTNALLVSTGKAMLLDLEGNLLKNVTLALPEHFAGVRVAAAGSSYLVAVPLPTVVVQAVSSDGNAGTLQTLATLQEYTRIGLATDGERFLIAWPDKRIYSQLLARDGTPAGPVNRVAFTGDASTPVVAWRDGEYLLTFHSQYRRNVVRLAADGSPIGVPKPFGEEGYERDADIAVQGHRGIVLLSGLRAGVFDDQSVTGEDIFRNWIDIGITARPQSRVRLARLGDGYVAAWSENGRILLSKGPGSAPVVVAGSGWVPIDVVVDRSNIIWVLWSATEYRAVAVSRFRADLTPVDPAPILVQMPGFLSSTAAAAAEGVIALAYEVGDEAGTWDVAALLLWETGTGIARKDVVLTTAPFPDFGPTVAYDGSAFVYGWSHAKWEPAWDAPDPDVELMGARVSPDGQLLDATPVQIADDIGIVTHIDSARGANGVAIAWQARERSTRVALFGGSSIDLGGPQNALGELAPHNGGFLMLRASARTVPELTELQYVVLRPDLSVEATETLPPFEADLIRMDLDADAIGGERPVVAYSRVANGVYGNVLRVFVREAGDGRPRRRAIGR